MSDVRRLLIGFDYNECTRHTGDMMFKRLCLSAVVALGLTVASPSSARAQKITVEWENAALTQVVDAFAKFSGKTIVVASDVGTRFVTGLYRNMEWRDALDVILAKESLIARVDAAGIIHVEKRA